MFSGFALLFGYAIFRLQGHLPFNPQHFPAVREDTAWNTVVSFVTNTNWQSYAGETTMSYLSQMGVLALQNFLSAAVGIAVAVALIRGFARKGAKTIGNFWVDFVRSTLYVLLPIAFIAAIVFIGQGALQTLGGPAHVTNAMSGTDLMMHAGAPRSATSTSQRKAARSARSGWAAGDPSATSSTRGTVRACAGAR
jgi:K+-transporting ATPase ATPase A chain